jgi:hypothetical protein
MRCAADGGGIVIDSLHIDYHGPDSLLTSIKAAVLNSRQSKFPLGADPWVTATREAMENIREKALTVVTSVGQNTWELTLSLASIHKLPVIVFAPTEGQRIQEIVDNITAQFNLNPDQSGFMLYRTSGKAGSNKRRTRRDRAVAETADIIYPVSVRADGTMSSLLKEYNAKICPDFMSTAVSLRRPRPDYSRMTLGADWKDTDLIIHFTRTTPGAWPDENKLDYYRAVVSSQHTYCHSATATLEHILERKKICASARHIKSGYRVVGFTSATADNLSSLFRYRSRLINPNFEPYGIALSRHLAPEYSIHPVIYGDRAIFEKLPAEKKPFFQNDGDGHWRAEREWRHLGDFDFTSLNGNQLRVIVPTAAEAERVGERCQWPVTYLYD